MKLATSIAALCLMAGLVAQSQPADRPELAGYVLTPEWLPVSGGTVAVKGLFSERETTISAAGRFRIEGLGPGVYDVNVSVPRLVTHRLRVTLPPSGQLTLPPIQLSAGSYIRMRVRSPAGEPISAPGILRESFDVSGVRVPSRPGEWLRDDVDPDGTTTIGPLPPGMTMLALDTPPFARMRLRDVRVTGESPLVDLGSVTLQPGARLNVDLVDANGAAVPDHDVYLDDTAFLSPLAFLPVRTDAKGRATFERLGSGRYQLRTSLIRPCEILPLVVARTVDMPAAGAVRKTVILDGSLMLRFTSGGVPLVGNVVIVTLDSASPGAPPWIRLPHPMAGALERRLGRFGSACSSLTDANGRVTFRGVPRGPARLTLRLANSRWVRRLEVPADAREVVLHIPSGVLPLRIVDAENRAPVSGAAITWSSGGGQVETITSATGDALLDGVAVRPGSLTVEAPSHERLELDLAEPPHVLHEVAVKRVGGLELVCRVVNETGAPVRGAAVVLTPHDRLQVAHVAMTDREGRARFMGFSAGSASLTVWADRHAPSIVPSVVLPPQTSDPLTVALSRGHRIVVTTDADLGEGPHAIHVIDDAGASMDAVLDSASDRIIQGFGRASLGPLPPGPYVVELRTAADVRRQQIRIEDRDVQVVF